MVVAPVTTCREPHINGTDLPKKTRLPESFPLYRGTVRTDAGAESSLCIDAHTVSGRPIRALDAALCVLIGVLGSMQTASAQDLEPRAYAASPVGVRFVGMAAGRSTGDVVIDPSLPLEDVKASVGSVAVAAGTTFALFGRTALLVAAFPYARASVSGRIGETSGHVVRAGFADPRFRLSVNLLGGRALSPAEFAKTPRSTIVGASVIVAPGIGTYDRTRLINVGANRWSFKTEVGASWAADKWTIETYAGAWIFTTNDEFYTGSAVRTQNPIVALQGHVGYTMKPRLWLAFDATWYSGGSTSVDGVRQRDLLRNSRVGGTFSLPLGRAQSIKVSASTGATTRSGSDFKTIAAAWQLTWMR